MTASGPIHPATLSGPSGELFRVTPETAGWTYLEFAVHQIEGEVEIAALAGRESGVVILAGEGVVTIGALRVDVSRSSVFEEAGRVIYVPPGVGFTIESAVGLTIAIGSAPASGDLPVRVIEPHEVKNEIRGGGRAHRQILHSLAPPIPAERLIVYEVYVPRGTWSGWPPHCHDGRDGSPYLEETYYFRLDRPEGYAIHRNWRQEENFDDTVVARDGDVVLVPKGYHSSVACPGSNMYFLNFLAGEPVGEERTTPPCFAAEHTWIEKDWTAGEWGLPVIRS